MRRLHHLAALAAATLAALTLALLVCRVILGVE